MRHYRQNHKARVMVPIVVLIIMVAGIACFLSACGISGIDALISSVKGELVGNSYHVYEYDNFGNKIMTVHGNKIALDDVKKYDGEEYKQTSYIDITIDGYEWNHVGGTLIFVQDGANMVTDFQVSADDVLTVDNKSTGLMGIDRVINNYSNFIGYDKVAIVYSQTGAPIAMFQGDDVYSSVPDDLPKTTLIHVDSKLVYVHRANIDIIPASLIKETK